MIPSVEGRDRECPPCGIANDQLLNWCPSEGGGTSMGRRCSREAAVVRAYKRATRELFLALLPSVRRLFSYSVVALRALLVWAAAWGLILQSTIALSGASEAAVLRDATSAAVICHSSSDGSLITVDPAAKTCPKCIVCALGHSPPPAQVGGPPPPPLTSSSVLSGREHHVFVRATAHERPTARGPPATA